MGIDEELKEDCCELDLDLRPTLLDLRIQPDVVADPAAGPRGGDTRRRDSTLTDVATTIACLAIWVAPSAASSQDKPRGRITNTTEGFPVAT